MTRVYICGPMTGQPDEGYPAFERAAQHLRDKGYQVISPREGAPSPQHIQEYLQEMGIEDFRQTPLYHELIGIGIAKMLSCDEICLLPGWEHSKGAVSETLVANVYDIPTRTVRYYGVPDE